MSENQMFWLIAVYMKYQELEKNKKAVITVVARL